MVLNVVLQCSVCASIEAQEVIFITTQYDKIRQSLSEMKRYKVMLCLSCCATNKYVINEQHRCEHSNSDYG